MSDATSTGTLGHTYREILPGGYLPNLMILGSGLQHDFQGSWHALVILKS